MRPFLLPEVSRLHPIIYLVQALTSSINWLNGSSRPLCVDTNYVHLQIHLASRPLSYALQAIGFFVGITYIVAIIINYVKRDDVKGTWLESHFRWQMRTFWFSLLWAIIGGVYRQFSLSAISFLSQMVFGLSIEL